jgi:hypothetical protein
VTDNIKPLPNRERDEMAADLDRLRRVMPSYAEAMRIAYDAYLAQGFDVETARYFVAQEFCGYGGD